MRLVDLFGAPLENVGEEHLRRLIDHGVREDADLDFKQTRYGNSDQARRELAADVAAMANDRGGVIVIGVRDDNDVAVETTPVELVDGEEARIRQVTASNIAPYVDLLVRVVETHDEHSADTDDPSSEESAQADHETSPNRAALESAPDVLGSEDASKRVGYYLIVVPPSTLRPHAVRKNQDLRYPRRSGSTTRWLSEAEVADMYRDRHAIAVDQTDRLDRILHDGLAAMDTSEDAFIAVGLVPTGSGAMVIDVARLKTVESWAHEFGAADWFAGFFGASPRAGVRAHRIALATVHDSDQRRPNYVYTELYDDGAGFACLCLAEARRVYVGGSERPGTWIENQELLFALTRCLHFVGAHAADNCGAWGDALVEGRIVGSEMQLAYLDQMGMPEAVREGRVLNDPVSSRHTVLIDAVARLTPELLATTRRIAADHFHAFGSPEVRHLAPDGTVRIAYFRRGAPNLREWCEAHNLPVTLDGVPGE